MSEVLRRLPGGRRYYPRLGVDTTEGRFEFDTTNCAIVARLVDKATAPDLATSNMGEAGKRNVPEWLTKQSDEAVYTWVDVLERELGAPEWECTDTCPECGGDGCETCEGEGTVVFIPALRQTWILGEPFNANLVACALSLADATGACRMFTWPENTGHILAIHGPTWRVLVMSVLRKSMPADAPRIFEPVTT